MPRATIVAVACAALVIAGCGTSSVGTSALASHPVYYSHHGQATLTRGRLADGEMYSVIGSRYRYEGATYFGLTLASNGPARPANSSVSAPPQVGSSVSTSIREGARGEPLDLLLTVGCEGDTLDAFAAGVLRDGRDSIVAHGPGYGITLHHAPIPANLHATGVLVYGHLPSPPTEIVTVGADRTEVRRENYGALARPSQSCPYRNGRGPSPVHIFSAVKGDGA
jgi:hypothetical protein